MPRSDQRLHRRTLAITAVLGTLTAVLLGWRNGTATGVSVALGAAVGALNFWSMARLVSTMMDENSPNIRRVPAGLLFVHFKGLILLAVAGALLSLSWVRGGSFLTGLLTNLVSIVLAVLSLGDDGDADGSGDSSQPAPPS